MTNKRVIALDVGDVRIGVAISDESRIIAQPLEVYKRVGYGPDSRYVQQLCQRYDTELVLLGLPLNMDGTRGERAEKCTFVKEEVEKLSGIETVLWDERATTKTALGMLTDSGTFGKKRKEVLDAVAATVILENYLRWRKNNK
jgi:putative Holliday junction resolvase